MKRFIVVFFPLSVIIVALNTYCCSIFPEEKIIFKADEEKEFSQVTVTENEGWYDWFVVEGDLSFTLQAKVINENYIELYHEGTKVSWLEKSEGDFIKWHYSKGRKEITDAVMEDHPFFGMFNATIKHWESKRPFWKRF